MGFEGFTVVERDAVAWILTQCASFRRAGDAGGIGEYRQMRVEGLEDGCEQRFALDARESVGEKGRRRIDARELSVVLGTMDVEAHAAADPRSFPHDAGNGQDAAAFARAEQEVVGPLEGGGYAGCSFNAFGDGERRPERDCPQRSRLYRLRQDRGE